MGARTWLNWTQYPDHGPDESLLGEVAGRTVVELGSGSGCNLAHLATVGAQCIGVDIAPSQREKAVARWGRLPGLSFHTADAAEFLAERTTQVDIVLSIFGAVWFTDPARLLPLIRERLAPGGAFVFSQRPPDEDRPCGTRAVRRWDLSPDEWTRRLFSAGFTRTEAGILPPPAGERVGTLLVRARA
ncbi:class I SAM-dependent methyltransferase [Streptomyces sp. DSM 44917]|uniref:Class I SAM-dependent methyltransferase n=1 Tax=Streptomyces boetiae TaxID=3075541 RepID=A0ABU2L5Z6_9ACTN|nr:class I SAM-dependent methyltransferase [Streptomyces sp. DSM 44917]MDT0306945.1 class I SAM-dependent methyltransferase [Streptomyces sp. DSM 44917]